MLREPSWHAAGTGSHAEVVGKEGQDPASSPPFHGCTSHTPHTKAHSGQGPAYNWAWLMLGDRWTLQVGTQTVCSTF